MEKTSRILSDLKESIQKVSGLLQKQEQQSEQTYTYNDNYKIWEDMDILTLDEREDMKELIAEREEMQELIAEKGVVTLE